MGKTVVAASKADFLEVGGLEYIRDEAGNWYRVRESEYVDDPRDIATLDRLLKYEEACENGESDNED